MARPQPPEDPSNPTPATAGDEPPPEGGLEQLQAEERAKMRQPADGTKAFRVRVIGGRPSFRRAGVEFSSIEARTVNRKDLTAAQVLELLNTPTLYVEELTTEASDAATVPKVGRAAPIGPDTSKLRSPGDAPVPSPSGIQSGDQHAGPSLSTPPSTPRPPERPTGDRSTTPGQAPEREPRK